MPVGAVQIAEQREQNQARATTKPRDGDPVSSLGPLSFKVQDFGGSGLRESALAGPQVWSFAVGPVLGFRVQGFFGEQLGGVPTHEHDYPFFRADWGLWGFSVFRVHLASSSERV